MDERAPHATGPSDAALRARARRVTPGGMTGYLNAANLPPGYPQFFARGEGCRLRDAATRVFAAGSFWSGAVAMAAALATFDDDPDFAKGFLFTAEA